MKPYGMANDVRPNWGRVQESRLWRFAQLQDADGLGKVFYDIQLSLGHLPSPFPLAQMQEISKSTTASASWSHSPLDAVDDWWMLLDSGVNCK